MPLLIKNADIVNADSRYSADILCVDDGITRIAPGIEPSPGT